MQHETNADTQFMQPADVARELALSPASVRHMADVGTLRVAARTSSGGRLFSRADVDRLVAERRARAMGQRNA